jgi:hypothetical protein
MILYWSGGHKAIFGRVYTWKIAMPNIHQMFAFWSIAIAPWIKTVSEAASACVLPFGFGGQTLIKIFTVCIGIVPTYMYYRVVPSFCTYKKNSLIVKI